MARPAESSSPRPGRGRGQAGEILGMDIKGHTVHRVLVAPTADIAEEYYFSYLVDRANRAYLCIASTEGGVEIEVGRRTSNPEAVAQIPIDPAGRRRRREGTGDRRGGRVPGRARRPGGQLRPAAVGGLRRGGRVAGRGQPAGPARRRHPRGARRQGDARRQRRVPAPRACRLRGPRGGRPAGGRGQGQGTQLRQARRRGRHHRQRRGPGHVDARRRRLRGRAARRGQARRTSSTSAAARPHR